MCSCQRTRQTLPPDYYIRLSDSENVEIKCKVVGVTGVEPVTLRLSSACSNQLSYTPTKPIWLAEPQLAERVCPPSLHFGAAALPFASQRAKAGGAEEIRTPDL